MEERIMKYLAYRKSGIALFDSSQEGDVINQVFNGFNDMIEPGALQAIQIALEMVETTASSLTGVFRERLGGIQQRDAVANVEAGMQQSYIITKQYYQVMDTLVAEMLTDALNLARKVYKKGLTGQIILGNKKQIFTALPEYYSQTDYDVHLANTVEIMKEQDLLRQMATQLAGNNQVDPEVLIDITTSKSLTEMKEALRRTIKQKKLENNQIQQLTQQLQEAQEQAKKMQQQLESNTKKLQQLNEQKLAIERSDNETKNEIQWYKVKSDADAKERELDLIQERNRLEALQLVDDNEANNEIADKKV